MFLMRRDLLKHVKYMSINPDFIFLVMVLELLISKYLEQPLRVPMLRSSHAYLIVMALKNK